MRSRLFLIFLLILAAAVRLYHLSLVPPSLYWDEASLGYNAFSISQTLRDEHGEFLPVARFIAFGDYKAPGYIYAAALSEKIFGLSEFSVRLPSALAGIFLVLLTYYLTNELLEWRKKNDTITKQKKAILPHLSATLVAISPWAIQFSRAAFEANLATLFSGLGIFFFLRAARLKSWRSFALCALSFALSLYTFNSHRVFVPMMIAGLCLTFNQDLLRQKKKILLFFLLFLLLILPLIPHLLSREGRLRFYEVTWLNDTAPIELSNKRISLDANAWWAKILHNRRLDFSLEFLQHYTDHFRADFLFFSGDVNPRLSVQTTGEMFWADLPLLLAGLFLLAKRRDKIGGVLLIWLLLSPVPAAVARETPHALRILQILPAPQILAAFGAMELVVLLKQLQRPNILRLTIPAFIFSYCFLFAAYLHDYYVHYPKHFASDWQYGHKQMVEYVSLHQEKYDHISITEMYGRPYIYLLFYEHYDPRKYWASKKVDRDWYGFWYVHGFDKFVIGDGTGRGRWLHVHGSVPFPGNEKLLQVIYDPSGKPVFQITEQT